MAQSLDNFAAELPESITWLCDQLAESIYIFDSSGIIRYANRAFEELTGFSRTEVVGESSVTLKSGAMPEAVLTEMWDQLRARESFRFVSSNRKKDGSTYDEGVVISPIHDTQTGKDFYVHIGRSIGFSRESFEVFAILADSAPAGIFLQREGIIYFVSGRLAMLLGQTEAELVGKKWLDLVAEPDRMRALEYDSENSQRADATSLECRLITPEGERWVMSNFQPLQLSGNQTVSGEFIAGYVVDITERKLAEERLRHAVSLQAATLESTTDGIVVLNRTRERVDSNRRYAEMWNIGDVGAKQSDELRALIFEQVKDSDALGRVMDRTWVNLASEDSGSVELHDGRHFEFYSNPQIVEGEVVGRVWSWRDITERRNFESALLRLANYDSLTSLLNRRKIQEELDSRFAAGSEARGALILLDLDGFKEVNDTFGHQAGDDVLAQVAHVLTDSDVGDLVGRFGGDEFAVLLPDLAPSEAIQAAENTLHRLSEHNYLVAGGGVSLTCSMGLALFPMHATSADELLSAADLALYEAKSEDETSLCVYSARLRNQSRLQRRGDWQNQLRDAILGNHGKLYAEKMLPLRGDLPVVYQLTIHKSGTINQVLSRRDIGALTQRASLSVALDRWLLDESIRLVQRPGFTTMAPGLSFEISVQSLAHPDIMRRMLDLAILRPTHGGPLLLELTSLDAIEGNEKSIATLRSAGYRFTASESRSQSLAQVLATMPVDFLNLEAELVRGFADGSSIRPLIEGAVHVARRLGASLVAKDVPDTATLAALTDLGLDYAVGPAIGPARSASTVFRTSKRRMEVA